MLTNQQGCGYVRKRVSSNQRNYDSRTTTINEHAAQRRYLTKRHVFPLRRPRTDAEKLSIIGYIAGIIFILLCVCACFMSNTKNIDDEQWDEITRDLLSDRRERSTAHQVKVSQVKSSQIKSNQVKSSQIKSNQVKFSMIEQVARANFVGEHDYPAFFLPKPIFMEPSDRDHFLNHRFEDQIKDSIEFNFNRTHVFLYGPYFLNGGIEVVENVKIPTIHEFGECGGIHQVLSPPILRHNQVSTEIVDNVARRQPNGAQQVFDAITFVDVWDSYSFQHFMDGVLPKLIRGYPQNTEYVVVLRGSRTRATSKYHAVFQIADLLGYTLLFENELNQRFQDFGTLYARKFGQFCRAPSMHPITVRKMKYSIISKLNEGLHHLVSPLYRKEGARFDDAKPIVYFKRNSNLAANGRHVSFEEDVIEYLQRRFGSEKVLIYQFDPDTMTAYDQMYVVRNAKLLIGPHGGALYNVMFSQQNPEDVTVVELMPENQGVHSIFWLISSCLGYDYAYIGMKDHDDGREPMRKLKLLLEHTRVA